MIKKGNSTVPILEARNISKVYGNGVYANKNICFSLNEGEIHALVGENGAGKSTLMKILFGMEKPSTGEILIKGNPVVFSSPQDAMKYEVGMVHQHFKLVDPLSITENVVLGYEPMKNGLIDRKTAEEKVKEITKIFDIREDLSTPVGKLPVGTKQKVEIVKALYRGAKILILDEPTAVLTPQETVELFEKLIQLKNEGLTVVFISHKLREVKQITDRISVIRRGELIETFFTKDVTEQEISAKMVGTTYTSALDKGESKLTEVVLDVKNITSKGLGDISVVNNMSFTVRGGQIIGIAGVEGNGQNELIEMITGLRPIDGGSVKINGMDTAGKSIIQLRNAGLSYIPSDRIDRGLAISMTIEDNMIATKLDQKSLYTNGLLSRSKIRSMSEKLVKEYLVRCNSVEAEVGMLSGGNMQKVVVAREFTQGATLIIAEQPTRGIDVGAAKFIYEELIKLRNQGCAVLLVSADLEELYKLSDHILVMYNGEISAYIKNPSEVSETELGTYMLGVKKQSAEEIKGAYYEKE
ncbi:MAG: ABC transporter ATP-binding protein [Clostridiales bacterium]|nr:ABC transporter ATP-binding protein [Clostridiales bacterium]